MTQAPRYQRGAVALLALLLLSLLAGWQVAGLPRQTPVAAREATTRKALQQARQILIDWAVQRRGVSGNGVSNLARPGALPCPDLHIPGSAAAGYVGNDKTASCNSAGSRLGRVPWRSLQQQARPDSAGETLWLALAEPTRTATTHRLIRQPRAYGLMPMTWWRGVALASAMIRWWRCCWPRAMRSPGKRVMLRPPCSNRLTIWKHLPSPGVGTAISS